ncbi:MAG: SDR family NAD(P)-dependent oxidoreductase [Sandaracinaceae bacterium]|nr:SDR family NAD(P)-dependent oxidoreductase [Sandaracinaceae bacterium]
MLESLQGRTALVTGASRGLGVYIARRLAAEGMHLVLSARDATKLETLRAELARGGIDVRVVAADVRSAADRARLVEEAGTIDVLVNNAGLEITRAFVDQSEGDVAAQLETNLVAPIDLTRRVLPSLLARKRGAVVHVSSMSGKSPTPYNAIYAATKYGLNGFTASIAIELEGSGVHAGVVCPSFVAEAGMWADTGLRAPTMMREVRPEAVADGVVAVIRGAEEVLVTPTPVRPLLALRELAPRLTGSLLKRMGVLATLEARAAHAKR